MSKKFSVTCYEGGGKSFGATDFRIRKYYIPKGVAGQDRLCGLL